MGKIKTTTVREKDQKDEQIFLVSKLSSRDDGQDEYDHNEEEDGEEQEAASQARLLSDMMKITKKKMVQQAVRTSLSTSAADTSHLLASLGPSALKKAKHSHTLPITLEKTVAKKIKRAAGYENVAMEANKWAKLVKMRREAEQLHFPLRDTSLQVKAVDDAEPLQMRQPLEKEVYALLQGAKLVQEKKETEEEEAVRKALSLEEIRERNRELWRQKEMKRRYEQKARLMNKSKSRKHHRLLRRERLRKQRAELEELQKTDSEAALEHLRELEQVRIEERMSLRHKTSKWAHLQGFRATKDKNAMAALQENQRMHRELTAKTAKAADTDDEEDSEGDDAKKEGEGAVTDPFNPWTKNLAGTAKEKGSSPADESFTRFKKFWEEVNRRKEIDQKIEEEMEKKKMEEDEDNKEEDDDKAEEEEEVKDNEEEEEEGSEEEEEEEEEVEDNEKEEEEEGEMAEEEEQEVEESRTEEPSQESPGNPNEKESEPRDNRDTETSSRKRKRNKKTRETIESLGDVPVSVDELLDEAEAKIKNKIQKKLKKLGMKSSEPWKDVKTKKKTKKKKPKTAAATDAIAEIHEFDFTSTRTQENIDEKEGRAKTLEDLESLQEESRDKLQEAVHTLRKGSEGSTTTTTTQSKEPKLQVDPNKFLQVEAKWLATAQPDNVGEAGEALDDEERNEEKVEDIIREAFADDYLMEEFSSEKAEAIKKDQPGSMSLALPGWGDWTGPSIKMSNTKMKKFRLRVPHAPRKDSRIGHVLYNERADVHTNLRKTMVSDLPYPFKSVKDFEASVRAPVGRLFVPEAAHKKLIAPATVTKIGTVIEPITEDELLRHDIRAKGEGKPDKPGGGGGKWKATSDAASQRGRNRKASKVGAKRS